MDGYDGELWTLIFGNLRWKLLFRRAVLFLVNAHPPIQEVNRHFNSANVWISMSLCYSASLSPGQNRHAVISAALSARLYHHNSGAPSLVTRDT